jgi:hypothetical protein
MIRLTPARRPLGSGLAEARHRGVDDARIDGFHVRGAKAELVERPRPVRLEQYVRGARELEQDLDRLRSLEIEHEAALVAVERDEAHALAIADRRRGAAHVALRRLDLDHLGAHVGEQCAGERAGDEIRQLDDLKSCQRFWHVEFPCTGNVKRRRSALWEVIESSVRPCR